MAEHKFLVRRQDGIGPFPENWPCASCGRPKSEHRPPCKSVLMLKGEAFPCGLVPPHDGWAHSNEAAEAIWL